MKRAAILLLLVVLLSRAACAATYLKGKAFLLDGDTIELNEERITIRPNEGKTDATAKANDGSGEHGRHPVRGS